MNGAEATGISLPSLGSEWDLSIGDFDNDGDTDAFARNTQTGQNLLLRVDGENLVQEELPSLPGEWIVS